MAMGADKAGATSLIELLAGDPAGSGVFTGEGRLDPAGQTRALLQPFVDSLPLCLVIKDYRGRRVFVNKAYCDLHGGAPEDLLGKTDFDLFPEELARRYCGDDAQVLCTGKTIRGQEQRSLDDPDAPWIERIKSPIFDAQGSVVGVQVLFWDVSDRVAAEKALSLERDLLHSLMDNIPDSIYFKDRESRFLRASQAMADKFGLDTPADVIGKTDADVFTEEHATQALEDEQIVMRTGRPLVARIERETWPDHDDTWASSTKMPLRNSRGEIVGTFGISRDVTELKRTEDELKRARDAADAANKAKSEFLANISHEIRTPMNGILGMTELLLATRHTDEQHEYLQAVKSSAESLLAILNDVLDFSKIEAGRLELERTPFLLRDTLGGTLRTLAGRAAEKGLELAVRIPPETPDNLVGDPIRLRQVIVNLVGNAIKFTNEGEVVVSVRAKSEDDKQARLQFTVRDTGIGVPAEKKEDIFQAFIQADSTTTRKYGGTGLGLTISSKLVGLMGGRIWLESEPGRGATFHFTAEFGRSSAEETPRPTGAEALRGVPVLIVDDSRTNRVICREITANWGMRPTCADSAAAALEEIDRRDDAGDPFQLILLDMMMPEMDGFDFLERLRERKLSSEPAVIVLSSAGRADDRSRAEQLGVARSLTKPVTQSDLFDATARALGATMMEEHPSGTLLPSPDEDFRPRKILLAEDGAVNQMVAMTLLEKRGHDVTVVSDGHEAVAAVAKDDFDVVVMDLQMPDMDGLEATQAIRASESSDGRRLPIIAMTAHALKGDRERCMEGGMDAYVSKPFRPDELYAAVESFAASGIARPRERSETPDESPPALVEGDGSPPAKPAPHAPDGHDQNGEEDGELPYDRQAALVSVGGSESLLADMARLFVAESDKQVADVRSAWEAGQADPLGRAAHSLKGSASVFGAQPAYEAALAVEKLAKQGHLDACPDALKTLEAEVERLKKALVRISG